MVIVMDKNDSFPCKNDENTSNRQLWTNLFGAPQHYSGMTRVAPGSIKTSAIKKQCILSLALVVAGVSENQYDGSVLPHNRPLLQKAYNGFIRLLITTPHLKLFYSKNL